MFTRGSGFTLSQVINALLIAALGAVFSAVSANSETPTSAADKKSKLVDLWQPGDSGQRMNIRGRVTGLDGMPLGGIQVDIRQSDGDGNWTKQYSTTLTTDAQGRYQFGSVVPGNYTGARHVHMTVYQDGWEYFDKSILFKGDPNVDYHYQDGEAIFLEESTVNGETIMFGRFDIVLTPE